MDDLGIDDYDEYLETEDVNNNDTPQEKDGLSQYLESKGISDMSRIKFQDDNGNIEERDWNTLSNEEQLNILQTPDSTDADDLYEDEIQLINAIRSSQMTPQEYFQTVAAQSQQQANGPQAPQYTIDDYSDDELYVMDLISRTGDITDEEAAEALVKAKENPTLFEKQMKSVRAEYKQAEDDAKIAEYNEQQEALAQQQQQYSQAIVNEINNLTDYGNFSISMTDDEKQEIYDLLTGADAQGVNHFVRILHDPRALVKIAWLAINGERMLDDITDYYNKEITNVRQNSYNQGRKSQGTQVVYKEKPKVNTQYDDLDDFE